MPPLRFRWCRYWCHFHDTPIIASYCGLRCHAALRQAFDIEAPALCRFRALSHELSSQRQPPPPLRRHCHAVFDDEAFSGYAMPWYFRRCCWELLIRHIEIAERYAITLYLLSFHYYYADIALWAIAPFSPCYFRSQIFSLFIKDYTPLPGWATDMSADERWAPFIEAPLRCRHCFRYFHFHFSFSPLLPLFRQRFSLLYPFQLWDAG